MAGNLALTSASPRRTSSKALIMISGSWFRTAPDESSTPLQTRSYWSAVDGQRINFAALRALQKHLQTALRASRTGYGRIPARPIRRRSHTSGNRQSSRTRSALCPYVPATFAPKILIMTPTSLRCRLARGDQRQRIGLKTQTRSQLVLAALRRILQTPPASSPFSSSLEPVALDARLHLGSRCRSLSI